MYVNNVYIFIGLIIANTHQLHYHLHQQYQKGMEQDTGIRTKTLTLFVRTGLTFSEYSNIRGTGYRAGKR